MSLLPDQAAARFELHAWLHDLEALRPFVDADSPEFTDAWKVAYARAKESAKAYAAKMTLPGDGT